MKTTYSKILKNLILGISLTTLTVGCNDYLDITPPSNISPEEYLKTSDQLGAYMTKYYEDYKK